MYMCMWTSRSNTVLFIYFIYFWYTLSGTSQLLAQYNAVAKLIDEGKEEIATKTACNKDTGGKRRLQKWTREAWFCISGGGHIEMWQPLYQ